jgi:hypothetical protein
MNKERRFWLRFFLNLNYWIALSFYLKNHVAEKKRHIYDKKNKKCMDKRRKFQQQKLHFCIEFKLFNFLQIMIMIKGVN